MAKNGGKTMKDNYSTTEKSERLSDSLQLAKQWETIDWKTVESEVNRIPAKKSKNFSQ